MSDDKSGKPSKVLFLGQLPAQATESDIKNLGRSYGAVRKALRMREKNHAFLEFDKIQSAIDMVKAHHDMPLRIRNQELEVQFSPRQQITINKDTISNNNSNNSSNKPPPPPPDDYFDDPRILLVTVNNPRQPYKSIQPNCDKLYDVFTKCGGRVVKIVTFVKNGQHQALVELTDGKAATRCRAALNGNAAQAGGIYKVDFSKLNYLSVKGSDKFSRDYSDRLTYGRERRDRGSTSRDTRGGSDSRRGDRDDRSRDRDRDRRDSRRDDRRDDHYIRDRDRDRDRDHHRGIRDSRDMRGGGRDRPDRYQDDRDGRGRDRDRDLRGGRDFRNREHDHFYDSIDHRGGGRDIHDSHYGGGGGGGRYNSMDRMGGGGRRGGRNDIDRRILANPRREIRDRRDSREYTRSHSGRRDRSPTPRGPGKLGIRGIKQRLRKTNRRRRELQPAIMIGQSPSAHLPIVVPAPDTTFAPVTPENAQITASTEGEPVTTSPNAFLPGPNDGEEEVEEKKMKRRAVVPYQSITKSIVLLISNLAVECTPDMLYNLFSTCGNVVRVKIIFQKQDKALVEFQDVNHAELARNCLHGAPLFGTNIHVTFSKLTSVPLPEEGSPESMAKLTKDYTNSNLHRFYHNRSKNASYIMAPTDTLHLSGIPPSATEAELSAVFTENLKACRFLKKNEAKNQNRNDYHPKNQTRMCLLRFHTATDALTALMKHHNAKLPENHEWGSKGLQIAFSKSTMEIDGEDVPATTGKRKFPKQDTPTGSAPLDYESEAPAIPALNPQSEIQE